MALWKYIKNAMLQHPNRRFFENEASMTYEEVVVFAEHFGASLRGQTCCAVLCHSEMLEAIAILSCVAADVTVLPLSIRYGTLHANKILRQTGVGHVITDASGELEIVSVSEDHYAEPQKHPAFIMCTSGTSGIPKGVMLSEKNIMTNISDISSYLAPSCNDRILICRPLFHSAVLTGEFLTGLLSGADIRFCSDSFQPAKLLSLLEQHQITMIGGTPTMLRMLARFKRVPLPYLNKVIVSGECMSEEVGRQLEAAFPNALIFHVYGLTEASPRVSYLPPDLFHSYPNSVGIPLNSVAVRIIKTDNTEAKENEEGLLWVKGENVMLGYYRDPEQTARVLKDGWLCTGDIAKRNEDGYLFIKGRADDMIIRAGMNIYPQEIEAEIKKDPRVKEVLVCGVTHPHIGTQIAMKISGAFSNREEIMTLCKERLPAYQIPSTVDLVEELPKTVSGKLLRGGNHARI